MRWLTRKEGVIDESQHEKSDKGYVPQSEGGPEDDHSALRSGRTGRRDNADDVRQNAATPRFVTGVTACASKGTDELRPLFHVLMSQVKLYMLTETRRLS